MGLGIALTAKSNLGTTPTSSISYVLSLIVPLSFGQLTFLLCIVFLLIEVLVMGRDFPRFQYLQLPVSAFFSCFVDVGMALFARVVPRLYAEKILVTVIASAMMAVGVYLQVIASVLINSGEGAVKAVALRAGKRFGSIKVIFDSALLILAAAISLVKFGSVRGVREGSILSAILVGNMTNGLSYLARHIPRTNRWLHSLADDVTPSAASPDAGEPLLEPAEMVPHPESISACD